MSSLPSSGPSFSSRARGGDLVALFLEGDSAQHAARGLALGADQLGLLLVPDMRGVAPLSPAVDGDLVVAGRHSVALDVPLDSHPLDGRGIDLSQHPLEGRFLRIIPAAVALAVAAHRSQLRLGEFGGEGGQVALARTMPARDAMTMMAGRQRSG